uniref:FHA domain-containing protein n=1 Tax=Esox lucius TaxID=8010 RepID=A0A3P8XS91_ESOLU
MTGSEEFANIIYFLKRQMRGYLKATGWVFKLQAETTTVGRHRDCDLCLLNEGVEEHHARIVWSKSERCFVLSDLNTSHGTYVNDCCIHNAAVRLTPGDELSFGCGGSIYQLAIDSPPMLRPPPIHNRTASQNSHQLIEEPPLTSYPSSPFSQLPLLPGSPSVPIAWVSRGSSITPRPPDRQRAATVGAKWTGQSNLSKQHVTSSRIWTGPIGRGPIQRTDAMASQSSQALQHLLQEKEERLLRQEDQVRRLVVFESESQRKDGVIAGLRDEVSALRHQLTMSQQTDHDIKHRLLNMERDINDKREQIELVKEQMIELQKCSSEVIRQSVTERDLKISNIRGQMERLKRENRNSTGLITSLQRDLASREKQALKLASEVDRLRQEIRRKDIQLGSTATKISTMSKKHQEELLNHANEAMTLKKSIEKLEDTLREKQRLLEHQTTEKDLLYNRLKMKFEEQASMLAEYETQRHSQQERSKAELELVQAQVKHFRDQLLLMLSPESSDSTSCAALSDQQVLQQLAEFLGEKERLKNKLEESERGLLEALAEHKMAAEDSEKLKSRLETCQELCSADALKKAMTSLQEESVSPALAWVQASVLSIMATHLMLLQSATQALLKSGIDVSHTTEGVLNGITTMVNEHQRNKVELQHLKVHLENLQEREANSTELQVHLRITREELEQHKKQMVVKQHDLEKELEEKKGELEEMKGELEEKKGELETVRQAQTTLQQEVQTQEASWHAMLEETGRREEKWQSEVQKALERGSEEERERYRVREVEYREQVRQHAHTIVALEKSLVQSTRTAQELKQERDTLIGQLRALELKSRTSVRSPSPLEARALQAPQASEANTTSRADLAQSQLEMHSQGDIIEALSRDLASANSRITDLTGELSEKQKMELEQLKALVVDQRVQLSMLTQKLMLMSQLIEQKGEELQKVRDELRLCQVDLEKRLTAEREMKDKRANPRQPDITPQTKNGWPHPGEFRGETLDHSSRLDLSDALDLSERTYLDLARALCKALELSEGQLEGCMPLQHLSQEERARLGSLRHTDLDLLLSRVALQQSHAERLENLLQQEHREMTALRESQAADQEHQARLDILKNKLEAESQESSLLHKALLHTQNSKAVKNHKAVSVKRVQKKSGQKTSTDSSICTEANDKVHFNCERWNLRPV